MRQFINLTSRVINKLHIVEIVKQPNKYQIYMSNHRIDGIMIFSSGSVDTTHNIIEICEKNNQQDYNTIRDWINTKTLD